MADGDVTYKELFRFPGGGNSQQGFSSTGEPIQNKEIAVYSADFTYNTGGIVLKPKDVKLTTIDAVLFTEVTANNDTEPTAATPFSAVYDHTNQKFIVTTNASTQAPATDSQDGTCKIVVFGTSARNTVALP